MRNNFMEDNFTQHLKVAGLSENEAKVYLAVLELGPSAIWDVSKKSGVKRPTCYVLLEELTMKGIAKSHNDGKRVVYSVVSPRQLAVMEGRKHNKFISLLPQLEGMASKASTKPKVSLFEGAIGIMEVYNMTLELSKGSEILMYGTADVRVKYGEFIDQYLRVRASKGIKARAILPDTSNNKQIGLRDPLELRETRFLPVKTFDQRTEVNIFADSIAYIAHSENQPFATIIENSRLAEEERMRFELLWETAER
jgi:sugar-specific transcriptional regulator TrmB